MHSGDEEPMGNRLHDWVGQDSPAQHDQLEIAQQIARETLREDHQALELDARFSLLDMSVAFTGRTI